MEKENVKKELPDALENCSFGDSYRPATQDLIIALPKSSQKPLVCESSDPVVCHLNGDTLINHDDVPMSVAKDTSKTMMYLNSNNDIYFLPVSVHESFPNIEHYAAERCSIQEISKKHFENLTELQKLWLDGNFITKIKSDTFEGLDKLADLNLGKTQFSGKPSMEVIQKSCHSIIHLTFFPNLNQITILSSR